MGFFFCIRCMSQDKKRPRSSALLTLKIILSRHIPGSLFHALSPQHDLSVPVQDSRPSSGHRGPLTLLHRYQYQHLRLHIQMGKTNTHTHQDAHTRAYKPFGSFINNLKTEYSIQHYLKLVLRGSSQWMWEATMIVWLKVAAWPVVKFIWRTMKTQLSRHSFPARIVDAAQAEQV